MISPRRHFAALFALILLVPLSTLAQSFRGGINGTVTDVSGAVVPGAAVTATNDGTQVARDTTTSSGGEFAFQDLPVGTYTVSVVASGFTTEKIEKVTVSAGSIYTVPVKLTISGSVQV